MSRDDNPLASALWLVVGGAAGYAAGQYVVRPWLATRPSARALPRASSSGAFAGSPYAGPSGDMRPIDPYADAPSITSVSAPTAPSIVVSPSTPSAPTAPSASSLPVVASTTVIDGPITMPSQVATSSGHVTSPSQIVDVSAHPASELPAIPPKPVPTASPVAPPTSSAPDRAFATKPRVRRFDPVFEKYRGRLPIEYVRALVERESDGNPAVRAGSATGLMQITPVVLTDYNKRHGTAYTREHLTDPATNVAIGCELLRLIASSYRKHHPRIATMREDWNNPRFVELLTFGWNAGFSEAGGVGRVVRYLEGLGAVEVDIDQVSAHAKLAGASKHLSNPAKVAWSKGVAALYRRERALASTRVLATS